MIKHLQIMLGGTELGNNKGQIILDGVDVAPQISGFELSGDASAPLSTLTLFALTPKMDVELDAECYIVRPVDRLYELNIVKAYLMSQDPSHVEAAMLEQLQWGGPQKSTYATIATLLRGLDAEINELAPDSEVPGGADGGHVLDPEVPWDPRNGMG